MRELSFIIFIPLFLPLTRYSSNSNFHTSAFLLSTTAKKIAATISRIFSFNLRSSVFLVDFRLIKSLEFSITDFFKSIQLASLLNIAKIEIHAQDFYTEFYTSCAPLCTGGNSELPPKKSKRKLAKASNGRLYNDISPSFNTPSEFQQISFSTNL